MNPPSTLILFLALSVGLAGCLGSDDLGTEAGPNAPEDAAGDEKLVHEVPTWEVGDYWTYDTTIETTLTIVVTGEEGQDWRVDTTNEEAAFLHAQEEISYLGHVSKASLAGSQGPDRVEYFTWPLTDGDTWTTRWDGVERSITANVTEQGASLEAYEGDRLAVTYTYDADTEWFGAMAFHGPDGDVAFGMELVDHGSNYEGDVVRWTLEPILAYNQTPGETSADTFTVPETGITDLWISHAFTCEEEGGFAWTVNPTAPPAPAQGTGDGGGCEDQENTQTLENPPPGDWSWTLTFGGDPAPTLQLDILLRTLETIPVEAS